MYDWLDAPRRVREITSQNYTDVSLVQVHSGTGSDLAATLLTNRGAVFLKAVSMRRPRAQVHRIEVRVQEYLPALAPRMLWHTEDDEWLVMCFEHVEGRHVDISPRSADLGTVAMVLDVLAHVGTPRLPVLPIEKRWAPFAPADVLDHLRGTALVHTDLAPANILRRADGTAQVVDWAWPTLGAYWLDTALMVPRLILAGHSPEAAEAWARSLPTWPRADRAAIDALVTAHTGFARERGFGALHEALQAWHDFRRETV